MSTTIPKWNEERENTLTSIVGSESPVTAATVATAAETLETTTRSVAAKLRKMGVAVESMSKDHSKAFSAEQEAEISDFLNANDGVYTYAEVASAVLGGEFSTKRIQGKILSMELTDKVKPTPKPESVKTYTDAEEAKLLELVLAGGFIEDIAAAMGREVPSVRGKILSMSRSNPDVTIPKQRESKAKSTVDGLTALGDSIAEMTVEDIATAIEKSERGVKTMLTHRGITCKNYDGAKKKAKIAESKG